MLHEKNSADARRWFEEVWNRKSEGIVHEMLAPNIVAHLEPMDVYSIPEFLEQRAILLQVFPDIHIRLDSVIAQGNEVALRWTTTGTHLGAFMNIQPSGRQFTFRGMTWLHFENGKIVEGWDSWNQAALLQQLQAEGNEK